LNRNGNSQASGDMVNEQGSVPDDMREATEKFYAEAEITVNAFAANMDSQPPPPTIYHYTDDAGLRGILQSGKMWITDIFNLNDPTELKHGMMAALDILKSEADGRKPEVKHFSREMAAMFEGDIERIAHFFVCCFSLDGDDLGQWRAYADNGKGYALGFDGDVLEQAFVRCHASPTSQAMTFPVTYDDNQLRDIQQKIISRVIPLISAPRGRDLPDTAIHEFMNELAVSLSVVLLRLAMFFKHLAYRNEQEYRFMCVHREGHVSDVRYRSRPNSLVRYREFDWRGAAANSFKEIVIGPAADRSLALPLVKDCLRAFHPKPIDMKQSVIPYRA
jgi:Protein of unknown function (DUF2971)